MTKELRKLKEKLGTGLTIIKPNGTITPLSALCNSTKIDKKISTQINRGCF